ncbi:MAG: type IV secretory system conjugative DNA transfer family protein, partial [Gaiellaceae bacterium]
VPAAAARGELGQRAGTLAPLADCDSSLLPELLAALEGEQGEALLQLSLRPLPSGWISRALSEAQALDQGRQRRSPLAALARLPLFLVEQALLAVLELIEPGPSQRTSTPAAPQASLHMQERARALRARARSGGVAYACGLRFYCHAPHPARSKAWAQAVQSQLRPLEGPHNGLAPVRVWPWRRRGFDAVVSDRGFAGSMLLTAAELALLTTPSRSEQLAELQPAGARKAPPPLTIDRGEEGDGRPFAVATFPGRERDVVLTRAGARTHLHVLGPPGSGKTSMLLRLALGSAQAGDGTGVWEPKSDLARAFLLALPEACYERLCLIDLAEHDLVVGLNPLECTSEEERERVADDTLSVFKRRFQRYWGPQTDDLFKGALRTLLHVEGSTLLELPLLLTDPSFRKRYLDKIDDPVALGPFWSRYETLSPGAQAQAIGPVLNKLRDFLFRSQLRYMLGQSHSTVSFERLLADRSILVMNLPKGAGREAAEVVGAFSLAKLWQAALSRSELPERERADFHCYLDEFQNFLHSEDFAEILAEARALRLSLCLAHQTLAQLPERETGLLLNLVRNLVCFQPGHEDAARLARALAPSFERDDLLRLGPYEIAVRLSQDGATHPAFSARTLPPPSFDPTPWIHTCKQQHPAADTTAPLRPAALRAAAAAAWNNLDPGPREQLLAQLEPLLTSAATTVSARVEALDALPDELLDRYRQLTAALRRRERAQLQHLDQAEIAQRIVRVALARTRNQHGVDPTSQDDDDTALLAELNDEQWASAVEQERLQRLRRLSALRYGTPVWEVELAIRRRLGVTLPSAGSDGIEDMAP